MAVFQIHEDLENIAPRHAEILEKKSKLQQPREILNDITNGHRGTKRNRAESNEQECDEHNVEKKPIDLPLSLDCLQLVGKEDVKQLKENPEEDKTVSDSVLNTKEYTYDIWKYLYRMEAEFECPKANYMSKQRYLNGKMRGMLVNWLVTVADEYNMSEQTIHLSVNYIDRFLSHMSVVPEKFQLLGAAAMMLAIKVEEVNVLDVSEWVYLSGMAFTSKQVVRMEKLLLKVLKFDMNSPTMVAFIQQLCVMHQLDKKTLYTAMYISELVLLEGGSYLQYLPSMLAAASITLAKYILNKKTPCFKKLESSSGYNFKQLKPIVAKQYETFKDSPNKEQQAIQSKYKTEKYHGVAKISPRALYLEECD